MTNITTKQAVLFNGLSKKLLVGQFDQAHASSDGGAILLKACDERLKLSETLSACLQDDRQQSKVMHSLQELFQQRMSALPVAMLTPMMQRGCPAIPCSKC